MKPILPLAFLLILTLNSCILKPDVVCTCSGNGKTKTYDLGKQFRPDLQTDQLTCDTLGAQDHLDTCRAQALD